MQQIIGNICVGVATLIFLLPLQRLMRNYARQHLSHDRWVTPALFLLLPLWLLLTGALLIATANGGFDSLRLGRPLLYALTVGATLALSVVSFVFVALYIRPGFLPRALFRPPIYLIFFATLLLAILLLNPQLASGFSRQWLLLPWVIVASLSLVVCGGYFGYCLVTTGGSQFRSLAYAFANNRELTRKNLAIIPTLDPQSNFTELLRLADESQRREVRDAALAQVRLNPDFVARLVGALKEATPSSNELDYALAVVDFATFTPDEQKLLALPVRNAMTRTTVYLQSQFRYFLQDKRRRKAAHRWGHRLFTSIATKFVGTGVDFQTALANFEKTFTAPDNDNDCGREGPS